MPDHVRAMVTILKGATINLFGISVHLLLVFGYSIFLARVLNTEDLGRFFLGFTILNFLIIVSMLGLDFAIWRYVALFMGEDRKAKARGVIVSSLAIAAPSSVVVAIAWVLGSDWISENFFHDLGLSPVFTIFAWALPFMVIARVFNASTQGLRKMHYQVISKDLGEQFTKFALSAALVTFGLTGILFANVVAGAISAILAFWFLQKTLPIIGRGVRVDPQHKTIIAFSLPLVFSTIFSYLLIWVDSMLLAYFEGSAAVGLYGIAARVAILGTLVLTSFNTMFSPVISDLYNRREMVRLKVLFKFVTKWVVIISLPIFLLVLIFAEPLLRLFGEAFTVVTASLMILAVGQFINTATGPVAGMVLMSGRPYLDLVNNVSAVILNVVLCLLLIPSMGIMGAAIANAVAQASINIIRAVEVYLIMGVHGYDRTFLKPVISGLLVGGLTLGFYYLLGSEKIWIAAVLAMLFMAGYGLLLLLMGLDDDDRAMLKMVKEKLTSAGPV